MSDSEQREPILHRDRPVLDDLSEAELAAEYAWCEATAARKLDAMDLFALHGRMRAIERRLAVVESTAVGVVA